MIVIVIVITVTTTIIIYKDNSVTIISRNVLEPLF